MSNLGWCKSHSTAYDKNQTCVICAQDIKKRTAKIQYTLNGGWQNLIPFEERVDFLMCESVYCRNEHRAFNECDRSDNNEVEKARIVALEARAEFLSMYLQYIQSKNNKDNNNVYRPESSHIRGMD